MKKSLILAALFASALVGCASDVHTYNEPTYEDATADRLIATNRAAIDSLFTPIKQDWLGNAPILVATLVNVNDLRNSSGLGRAFSEQYSSAIANKGFNVKELKLRGNVFVQEGTGELLLSREVKDIAQAHKATVVLVGTYAVASQLTYINIKLVRTEDGRILSAYDYALPNDRNVNRLLQSAR